MAVLHEKSVVGGGKGAEFAEYFRRNTCIRQVLRNIYRLYVVCMRKGVHEDRGFSKKSYFFIKNYVFSLWSTTFAENSPTRWYLGGTLPPNSDY